MVKTISKICDNIIVLLRLSSNYYSFLGGVFISTSVNFYTTIFASDTLPTGWLFILIAAILTFVSGFFWTALAWNLEPLQAIISAAPSDYVEQKTAWEKLVSPKMKKLGTYLFISLTTAVLGLASLLLK